MSRLAFITGLNGQDGAYLSRLLLARGYEVHGTVRRSSLPNTLRLERLGVLQHDRLHLHYGDVTDASALARLLGAIRPDEVYNLAAQSDVGVSFDLPGYTLSANALGAVHLLDVLRGLGLTRTRYYQASTSEIYGRVHLSPQNEDTPFMPCSPYGVSKLAAYWTTVNYRDYGMHASNGILFNHESPHRGHMFVSRKVSRAVAMIRAGLQDVLWIGNLDARRDWGHAEDFVEGIWRIVQHETPGDYVLATGKAHSVRDFINLAFACIGVTLAWSGSGTEETGADKATGIVRVRVDPALFRPRDIELLLGDAGRAERILDWKPRISFERLVEEMVETDCAELSA